MMYFHFSKNGSRENRSTMNDTDLGEERSDLCNLPILNGLLCCRSRTWSLVVAWFDLVSSQF